MGTLPGLNKLNTTTRRVDLLGAEDNEVKKVEVVKEIKTPRASVENDIKPRVRKEVKATDKKANGLKIIQCMVSAEFKKEVALFCAKNDYKEIELIKEAVEEAISDGGLNDSKVYDTNNKGSDATKMLYGRYESDFKKEVAVVTLEKGVTERYFVAQAVAKKIEWKKFV